MVIEAGEIPEKLKRRIELSRLFYPLERKDERRWGKLFDAEFAEIYQELQAVGAARDYTQEKVDRNKFMWKDKNDGTSECMFCLIEDITALDNVPDIFDKIKVYTPVFTYAIVHQKKDGDGVFDIFRFSKFSYLEHCNRVRSPRRTRKKVKEN
jgi:hypothetical protein